MASSIPTLVSILLLTIVTCMIVGTKNVGATWCIARSNAAPNLLQIELDYACGAGADCGPIQPGGSCFNPNTIYNHASYAFDSFYQRKRKAPGSCYFGGTATIAVTDPSFGACRYPSSLSNVGGANYTSTTMSPMNNSIRQGVGKIDRTP